MLTYRGYEIKVELTGTYKTGGGVARYKRYRASVDMQDLDAGSEEELCDKIDAILGPLPENNDRKK